MTIQTFFPVDGFTGDGLSNLEPASIDDRLAFLAQGIRPNVIVEVTVVPRLVDRTTPLLANDPKFDGFLGDGFSGINFLSDIESAPRLERFSTLPTNLKANDPARPNVTSRAILRGRLRVKQAIDPAVDGLSSQFQIGAIDFNDDDYLISEIAATTRVDGRDVVVYVAPEGGDGSTWVELARTQGDSWRTDQRVDRVRTATLRLGDLTASLQGPAQSQFFDGRGSLGGDPELTGRRKPFLVGRRRHVEGVLYDRANLLYMVHTGASSFFNGYFGGEAAPFHGDFDTEEDLIVARASMPEGSWASCARLGIYTPRPVGDGNAPFVFAVDCAGLDQVTRLGDAAVALLLRATNLGISRINTQAFGAMNIGEGGVYLPGTSETSVLNVLETLASSAFARITVGDRIGAVLLQDPSTASPTVTLTGQAIGATLERKRKTGPAYRNFAVNYAPNDRILSETEVAIPEANSDFKSSLTRAFETPIASEGVLTFYEHPTAREIFTLNSVLIDKNVAASVQTRIRNYAQYEVYPWTVEFRAQQINLQIGSVVALSIPEHPNWRRERKALVVGVEPQFTKGTILVDMLDFGLNTVG